MGHAHTHSIRGPPKVWDRGRDAHWPPPHRDRGVGGRHDRLHEQVLCLVFAFVVAVIVIVITVITINFVTIVIVFVVAVIVIIIVIIVDIIITSVIILILTENNDNNENANNYKQQQNTLTASGSAKLDDAFLDNARSIFFLADTTRDSKLRFFF